MNDLLIIVPTRGRPQAVEKLVDAWGRTGAFDEDAQLCFAIDRDDPEWPRYCEEFDVAREGLSGWRGVHFSIPAWRPMVHKLNAVAAHHARLGTYEALGFAGDDHIPRTVGWAGKYVAALRELGTGIVYGNDGLQGEQLPTQWAMTADIVRELGAMVPGETEHLYCDNIIKTLGREAECLRYLPDVLIEHMHPVAGKADVDHGYSTVNAPAQYARDQRAYAQWILRGRPSDVARLKALRGGVIGGERVPHA